MRSDSDYSFEDLFEGYCVEQEYRITPEIYGTFLELFPDRSPVHVDDAFARANGFKGVVMHGAILNGFLSHFVGMRLPGRRSLELTVDMRYLKPSYLGDTIRLTGTIAQKIESRRAVVMDVTYSNCTQGTTVARARVQAALMGEADSD